MSAPLIMDFLARTARRPGILAAATLLSTLTALPLPAQMLGVPVLQNAFANPGFTVAGNVGGEDGGIAYGLAAAWSPGGARFQLSGGGGAYTPDEGSTAAIYGARVMVPILKLAGGSIGVAGFAGGGGASHDQVFTLSVPVGAAVGYGRTIAGRGVSVYASPFYNWTRTTFDGGDALTGGLVRVSVGVDVGLFRSIGVTGGAEFGQNAEEGDVGPSGSKWGLGVSWAFGRR